MKSLQTRLIIGVAAVFSTGFLLAAIAIYAIYGGAIAPGSFEGRLRRSVRVDEDRLVGVRIQVIAIRMGRLIVVGVRMLGRIPVEVVVIRLPVVMVIVVVPRTVQVLILVTHHVDVADVAVLHTVHVTDPVPVRR